MKPGDTVPSANEPAELENQAVEPENATAEAENQPLNRRILSLAVPSLGSLLAEPLMVMADSAMIGHVGTTELAGLTLGSSVNVFLVGICIFLVYTTTAVASRQLGAGNRRGAVKTGVDGAWLGLLVGAVLAAVLWVGALPIVSLFGAAERVNIQGAAYLRAAAPSMLGMMLVLAGTGAMRGMLDAKIPLVISVSGAIANVAFNATFIYGFKLGVTGAGIGTSLAGIGMGVAFALKIMVGARRAKVALHPEFRAIFAALTGGVPLMIRTLTIQIVVLGTLWVAASQGEVAIAGRQIAANTWSLGANLHDSLAIAVQALIGFELGRADRRAVRDLIHRVTLWGLGLGVVLGVIIAVLVPLWPRVFSNDSEVLAAAALALLVSAFFQPLAGVVFVFDGVLIGANDTWYLALAGLINLVVYIPALVLVWRFAPDGILGLAWLWGCYCGVFFLARMATLGWRIRQDRWMKLDFAKPGEIR
ncbi:MATE family efflux transporter [Mobiluncus curtisii]|uniref:MATE family efflux transporter n=3 Tax=Mobiluncus curtisii TaxID=2051 RepID=UPI0014708399|nr:MATE family efflux transporter [Mobiluncus curtisii]NMW43194.1 MATE family efflux transporter [Mobiluncus curtisii]NMW47300.1 MATE family efflux transporter [Mobiluncus curtisii]NMW82861.1 MATE family efflux transporter [Mobiluncus curtisii]NMW99781.1 MATE family efflux transporter [Mobiluncus curtisii]NMX04691.1 MATE family efflux transporter [Mobiluncus curtisii]